MTSSLGLTLDTLLGTLAEDTWENLREAKLLSVRFGEETITDTLMLELRRKRFRLFKQTSLHDEAKYGTDFECWVGSDGMGWVGYAVQAKKLDHRTGTYRNLGHVVKGPNKRQIDILKDYAKARGLTPRYCLYSHSFYVDPASLSCCSRSFSEGELGCTITPPYSIERAIASRGGKGFHSLQGEIRTVPWRCLAICPGLRRALLSKSIASDQLPPLLDDDSIIYPRLPDDLGNLLEDRQREVDPRLFDNLGSPYEESPRAVDFEQLGIGADSRQMHHQEETSPRFIIPRRVYILDVSERPNS